MRNICPFYRRGICRYGVAGRLCPKDHPPACKKLTKHGKRSPNGCTLGRACDSLHNKNVSRFPQKDSVSKSGL